MKIAIIVILCLTVSTTAFCKKKGKKGDNQPQEENVAPSPPTDDDSKPDADAGAATASTAYQDKPTDTPPPPLSGELTTLSGKKYESVALKRVDPDGLFIVHRDGSSKVLFTDLSPELRAKYGYDPKKATAFHTAEKAAQDTAVAKRVKEQAAEAERLADEQRQQQLAKSVRSIQGRVVQVVKEGMIMKIDIWHNDFKGRPSFLMGLPSEFIFVVGHQWQDNKADGDLIDVDAYPDGVFSYSGLGDAPRRLHQYRVVKTYK